MQLLCLNWLVWSVSAVNEDLQTARNPRRFSLLARHCPSMYDSKIPFADNAVALVWQVLLEMSEV